MNKIKTSLDSLHRSLFDMDDVTKAAWIKLYKDAPNYSVVSNGHFRDLVSSSPFFAVSAIDMRPEELEKTGKVLTGIGCLGGALYAVPAYKISRDSFKLHNFGTYVMDFRKGDEMTPYLFALKKPHNTKPVNYLAMGELFYNLHEERPLFDSQLEAGFQEYKQRVLKDFSSSWSSVPTLYKNRTAYTEASYDQAVELIQAVAEASKSFHSLSYFYFEAVSLVLMLYSKSEYTRECTSRNELNNKLYIDLVNNYLNLVPSARFGSYGFRPSFAELVDLLRPLLEISSDSKLRQTVLGIANGLVFFIGGSLTKKHDVDGMVYYDFCVSNGYQDSIENQVSAEMLAYWQYYGIELVYNGTIEKGEVGITPVGNDGLAINGAMYDENKTNITLGRRLRLKIHSRSSADRDNHDA